MCTVTFIPKGGKNFILSSNRDESAARSPKNLTSVEQEGVQLVFPRDSKAGGSWVAIADTDKVVCLLNGGFVKHKHRPPYKRSRGIMVLDYFQYLTTIEFIEQYDFEGMEPFTMIMVENGSLFELIWDGNGKHSRELNFNEKYIWSSSTLYPPDIQKKRASWFQDWLKQTRDFSLPEIQDFHQNGGEKDPWNGFVMNRENKVQTVSLTNIIRTEDKFEMIYNDLIHRAVKKEELFFQTAGLFKEGLF